MPIDFRAVTISKSLEFPKWLISLYKKKSNIKTTRKLDLFSQYSCFRKLFFYLACLSYFETNGDLDIFYGICCVLKYEHPVIVLQLVCTNTF